MYERDFQRIIAEHAKSQAKHGPIGLTLGYLGRAAMAVQQSWNKADVLIKARVQQDIKAFVGRAQPQYRERAPNGIYFTMQGWPGAEQIFIPNIGDRHGRTPLGLQGLLVIDQQRVDSQRLY